jgi:PIN domain nuclease of toxin-antitoxin system
MTLLLDTCTFIWLCSDPDKLSGAAARILDDPDNERALSMASIWEIALKYRSGKLPLSDQPEHWLEDQIGLQAVEVLPLQRETLYRAAALPPVHKDPFDRVIAADALQRRLCVVSPDKPFERYGCKVVW